MHQSKPYLHCGAGAVTVDQLAAVPTPPCTSTWVPIAHHALLSGVKDTLARQGLTVVTEAHGLGHHGARYFGLLQVAKPGEDSGDFGLVVGVRNSHDKSFPAALALGAAVFVCDNLSFSGEVKLARKHTAYITRDLPQLTDRAVAALIDRRASQQQRFAAYQRREVSDREAHDLLIQALDARVCGCTHLHEVLAQWRQPRHPEFAQGGKTAWRLFNAFTEVIKGHLDLLPKRTQALHGIMDAACGLLPVRADAGAPQIALAV